MKDPLFYQEQQFKTVISSGPLLSIQLYQVNDYFFEISEEGYWILDAIQLKFPAGFITATFKTEDEINVIDTKPFQEIYTADNYFQLENENIKSFINNYVGLKVSEVLLETLEFEFVADYTMRTEKEKRFVAIILKFENGTQLQIALVGYELKEEGRPSNFSYGLYNEVLVAKTKMKIGERGQ